MARYTSKGRHKTTGTYKGRKYNGGSQLGAMKMMDKMLTPKKRRKKSGCYVATCVYGSYDCPEVWALRRYRDQRLAQTFWGRAFIRCYYAISPAVVKIFGGSAKIRQFWKTRLDRFVARVQSEGYGSEPYQDL